MLLGRVSVSDERLATDSLSARSKNLASPARPFITRRALFVKFGAVKEATVN